MKLQYRTRGMSDPRGKSKVYFTCHPLDFDILFPIISKDILDSMNCAIWYDAESTEIWEEREMEETISEMRMVVLGVTARFLREPNRAKDIELPFALQKHIPILPILMEEGLEREFNERCAEIQLMKRENADTTATPYEEVLSTFLKATLAGDEMAAKIRDAFDAYVFLSYRKKDRRHAQRLMRLIHENPQLESIAIWYDEFLIPGEDFNDAIHAAFEKSSFFALAVTPSLLEPDNYVMNIEYPLALERSQSAGNLKIIPVEMYEPEKNDPRVDQREMREHYPDLPPMIDEHSRLFIHHYLNHLARDIPRKEEAASARHLFFLGLAYLHGIDVEVNREKGLHLIQQASWSEPPLPEAVEKLAEMYWSGDGVARDAKEAMDCQRRLAEIYLQLRAEEQVTEYYAGYSSLAFRALLRLADMQREMDQRTASFQTLRQVETLMEAIREEAGSREADRDWAALCNRLGAACREEGEYAKAEIYYAQALKIDERQAAEIGTARARRDLSISLERMGDVARKGRKPEAAEMYYTRVYELRKELNQKSDSARTRRDLSAALTKLGNVAMDQEQYDRAEQYYAEALCLDRMLAEEERTNQSRDDLAVSMVKLADVHRSMLMHAKAREEYAEAVRLFSELAAQTDSLRSRKNLATALEKMTKSLRTLNQPEETKRCYEQAISLRKGIMDQKCSSISMHELATTYFLFAEYLQNREMMGQAIKLWEQMIPKHPEYRKYAEKARQMIERWL